MKQDTTLNLAPGLSLPIEVAGQAVVVLGIRGSGKTNTAGAMAEELLDHQQPIAIIDPTDAWWGLRAGRDGNQSGGYQVFIFGGSHADVPLQETDGKVIAEFLVHEQVSVILSLRHLRKAAQRRFVTEFCEELYHLKGKDSNRTPLTVFIDEAPLFVPQKVMGEVARTVGAVEDLIARGRNAGFGVVLISQRSATLNADVRTQADTMICHRVTAALDRKAIRDWFEENASVEDLAAILKSLATLKNGEGWIWSPSLDIMKRVQMRMRRTFDSSATPRIGQVIRAPKQLADINIDKLRSQMLAAIEQKKADDPKALKAEISRLKSETAKVTATVTDPNALAIAEDRGYARGLSESSSSLAALRIICNRVTSAITEAGESAGGLLSAVEGEIGKRREIPTNARPVSVIPVSVVPVAKRKVATSSGPGVQLPRAERKVLTALAQYAADRTKTQVAILTGYAHSGGGFNNALGSLRAKGYMVGSDPLVITDAGVMALGEFEPLPTGSELAAHWLGQLGKAERLVLEELIRIYPRASSKEEVAGTCGYEPKGGGFNNALGRLRALELISGKGELKASEDLF